MKKTMIALAVAASAAAASASHAVELHDTLRLNVPLPAPTCSWGNPGTGQTILTSTITFDAANLDAQRENAAIGFNCSAPVKIQITSDNGALLNSAPEAGYLDAVDYTARFSLFTSTGTTLHDTTVDSSTFGNGAQAVYVQEWQTAAPITNGTVRRTYRIKDAATIAGQLAGNYQDIVRFKVISN